MLGLTNDGKTSRTIRNPVPILVDGRTGEESPREEIGGCKCYSADGDGRRLED
jgi:hypothetical protein